ncbi:MAG TPA: hypothetical protein VM165_16890 [Planctomycetaceae bacterium]|nr:hypothetical protein [Planctomycetaceae bacterium]
MNTALPAVCRYCGKSFLIHRHDVSVHNRGALPCPSCKQELVSWSGMYFYTLAVSPPHSNPDMPIINETP